MRRAAKVDANQRAIVEALRAVGARVAPLHTVGGGVPDLLVGYRGTNFLLELKDGRKPPSAQKLTPAEVEWHRSWTGRVKVVKTVREALEAVGAVRTAPDGPGAPLGRKQKQSRPRGRSIGKDSPEGRPEALPQNMPAPSCGLDCDDPSCRAHWKATR